MTNPINTFTVPSVSITTARTGASAKANEFGMRTMQERAYAKRGEPYLLIKSPPASGKSRALMFIALDKLHNQGLQQAIVVVPERSIGGSFADEALTQHGFYWDWTVAPQWNLCNAPGIDEPRIAKSKVEAVSKFLASDGKVLVCTHATFRFAVEELGIQAFDNRLIAIDEFHHVSANPDNKLGSQLGAFIARDKVHVVAMTGSYFRGDSEAVLGPADEGKFETVTYTYYEQLNGYQWLKSLDIGYFFYTGRYVDAVAKVLDPALKTIVHIPSVNSRESLKDKEREVNDIMQALGEWKGIDKTTGFHLIDAKDGRTLKVADLVDDSDAAKRARVLGALKNPEHKNDRDHVDIIIALGMAKEGFDWIWCEHALTIGYRSSLTEVVQIIGRATRDAKAKERARFTNLIAEPTADQSAVAEAVNDMLKAISASLLMEQVLAPRYEFTPRNAGAQEGFDYGEDGYVDGGKNLGINKETGEVHIEINGLAKPRSLDGQRICKEDLNEVIAAFIQDKPSLERGTLDRENTIPEELTIARLGKIVRERYPQLSDADQEAVRQHAVAVINITQQAKLALDTPDQAQPPIPTPEGTDRGNAAKGNTDLIEGVRKFINVRDLDIDLIDRINPFEAAYAVLAKTMDEKSLRQIQASIAGKNIKITEDEARELAKRALQFKNERGRVPDLNSADAWEKKMAEGVAAFARYRAQAKTAQRKEPRAMAELDDDELLEALGVEVAPIKAGGRTPREERIIAGFEDILRFHGAHKRAPQHGEGSDIFERLYAVRLDQLRKLPEAHALLAELDKPGLLSEASVTLVNVDELDEDALLAELGVSSDPSDHADITVLRHVRSIAAKQAAEEIADRTPCDDFDTFQPLFERAERELKDGMRKAVPFKGEASVEQGNFFIVGGQFAYIAEKGEEFETSSRQPDARLRLIYGNGTESNLLMRSLQRALTQDGNGRRLSDPDAGPLFGPTFGDAAEPDDIESGTIYVLRSWSKHPFVSEHRTLIHKLGVTGGKVATRIADAENQATYLLAPVEIVAEYRLHNLNRARMENIFHRLFSTVQLDLTIEDRFGKPVKPREWFVVPLNVIDEAVERIRDGTITELVYDPQTARLTNDKNGC